MNKIRNEKITIVVPIYNVPKEYLDKCLNSLINQKYDNLEIILVDDGSEDECAKICDFFGKKDERIKVIHQKNKGLCGARNTGVREATGNWITFVDGDDWLENNTISNLSKHLTDDLDILIFGTIKEFGGKEFNYKFNDKFIDNKLYENEECKILQREVLSFDSGIGDSTAKIYNRFFLIKNNLYHNEEIRQGVEAMEFNVRVFELAKQIKFVKDYYYHYTYNDKSITNDFNEKSIYINLQGYKVIKENIVNQKRDDLIDIFYIRMMHNIISTAISGYFSPKNKMDFTDKKEKYMKYLNQDLIKEALKNVDKTKLSLKYKIILFSIKIKAFWLISFLAYIRDKQKN